MCNGSEIFYHVLNLSRLLYYNSYNGSSFIMQRNGQLNSQWRPWPTDHLLPFVSCVVIKASWLSLTDELKSIQAKDTFMQQWSKNESVWECAILQMGGLISV